MVNECNSAIISILCVMCVWWISFCFASIDLLVTFILPIFLYVSLVSSYIYSKFYLDSCIIIRITFVECIHSHVCWYEIVISPPSAPSAQFYRVYLSQNDGSGNNPSIEWQWIK